MPTKYIVFTNDGMLFCFDSYCQKMALATLRCKEAKTLHIKDEKGNTRSMIYLVKTDDGNYLFEPLCSACYDKSDSDVDIATIMRFEQISELADKSDSDINAATIIRFEQISGLAGMAIDGIDSEDGHSMLLRKFKEPQIEFDQEYSKYIAELFWQGSDAVFQGEPWFDIDEPETAVYGMYASTLPDGFDGYKPKDILMYGLRELVYDIENGKSKDRREDCMKLLVGYDELYKMEGYGFDSEIFAMSRVMSTKFFSKEMLLDCIYERYDVEREYDEYIQEVLNLYQ